MNAEQGWIAQVVGPARRQPQRWVKPHPPFGSNLDELFFGPLARMRFAYSRLEELVVDLWFETEKLCDASLRTPHLHLERESSFAILMFQEAVELISWIGARTDEYPVFDH